MDKYTIDSAMLRLKEITDELESGECDLEASMKIYEEGVRLVAFCNKALSAAKQRITDLSEMDMNGDEADE
ncbi:MAG: exodeoxyribonuclease VII small subunit [Faecalibacterium sp.]|nr:exodeoxyribonuclease VII small subunit [Ruminococcus sp.]MCM1392724.1 exodeoxyribonuclease VII small subunit [Ruminococcus sp.]MCM1485194.1 exodeoxyribonuclease VII small subunit [Faecalibacterium sp.]